ncbi:MAG: hypothetical protein ACRD50_10200 [Candidatus Acidiferrales bacterium]
MRSTSPWPPAKQRGKAYPASRVAQVHALHVAVDAREAARQSEPASRVAQVHALRVAVVASGDTAEKHSRRSTPLATAAFKFLVRGAVIFRAVCRGPRCALSSAAPTRPEKCAHAVYLAVRSASAPFAPLRCASRLRATVARSHRAS